VDEQQTTDDSAIYRAEWVTTGLPKCKKGERQTLQLQMQVENNATIDSVFIVFRCKVRCVRLNMYKYYLQSGLLYRVYRVTVNINSALPDARTHTLK